jgi:hypothetical protein
MGLKLVIEKGVETAFTVFKEAVKDGQYISITDNGWDTPSETAIDVRVILDVFKQEDVETLSFSELIQPTDTKGLVPGIDLTSDVKTSNFLSVNGRRFAIVAFDTDAFNALYTFLLRDTK